MLHFGSPLAADSGTGLATVVAIPVKVGAIVVTAVVVRWLALRAIRKVVDRAGRPAGPPGTRRGRGGLRAGRGDPAASGADQGPIGSARRQQRAATIGSLLRSITSAFIIAVAVIELLGVVDVNLAPIVASAGIVGVAVGFGAQNLIRDFISGMFMILEDQYGVGDIIDAGPATGTVEAISLRTTRLRDVHGVVWHVRNGTIDRVGNKSQGWARALLDIPVAYATPVAQARLVIKEVADQLWRDPDFASLVLEEPEVWGVQDLGNDGVHIRLVVKTAPLRQWEVARELRQRIKDRFDQVGIEIPFQQRTVWLRTEENAGG